MNADADIHSLAPTQPSRARRLLIAIAMLAAALVSCSHPIMHAPTAAAARGSLADRPIDHLVLIAIDGLERDTLLNYLLRSPSRRPGGLHDLLGAHPDGDGLMLTKAVTVAQAATVFPSYTYPAWTSMFTGVFPGVHGITGNSLFFRDRQIARYYTEYHVDAVKVQIEKDFLSHDISDRVKTLYEYVGEHGGQSLVVHHMITRGSGDGAHKPDLDTLWSYQRNRSHAVDENTLWEAVKSLDVYNGGLKPGAPLRLPTVMTIYFSGLDHAEHLAPDDPEQGRLEYLKYLDDLIAKFIMGDPNILRHHFPSPLSDSTQTDPIAWRGLQDESVLKRTLFMLVSDHGHTPTNWATAVGIEDLKVMFNELAQKNGKHETAGRTYALEEPALIEETWWSIVRGLFGFANNGTVSPRATVVAALNGGALGLYVKPANGAWAEAPSYAEDIVPMLEHVLLTLHKNRQGPQAVLYKDGSRYVVVPYRYDGSVIQLLPALDPADSTLRGADYPMAEQRLAGLAAHAPGGPSSAPDIILLADRSRQLTYHNKQDWRVIEALNVETHRHFHSDHGHLNASDSLVPIMWWLGGYEGGPPLATICEASIVDVLPTVLDIFGWLPSFHLTLQQVPPAVKGRSLKASIDHILSGSDAAVPNRERLCSPRLTLSR